MKLRHAEGCLIAQHPSGRWVPLEGEGLTDAQGRDLVAFLAGGEDACRAADAILAAVEDPDAVAVDPAKAGIPFRPRSMRAFMLWEDHVVQSSRMLVKHFFPTAVWRLVSTFEKTGRTFPS